MFTPGTLVRINKDYVRKLPGLGVEGQPRRVCLLVIAVFEYGFGTRGRKWGATFLSDDNKIVTIMKVWDIENWFNVIRTPE